MRVSVVIPAFNAENTIERQLLALKSQRFNESYEVIVINNRSTDRTVEVVSAFARDFPELVLAHESERQGVNAARNKGLQVSKGDFVLLCDADDVVSHDWMREMLISLEYADLVGGPALAVMEKSSQTIEMANESITTEPSVHGYLHYAVGCNMGMRREVLRTIGGFDESFVGGHDEVDFCWRAQQNGFVLTWNKNARVTYYQRSESKALFKQHSRYAATSVQLWERHHERGTLNPISFSGSVRNLMRTSLRFPQLIKSASRRDFLRQEGWTWGIVQGHLKYRKLGQIPLPQIPKIE